MKEKLTIKFWGVRGSHPSPGPETIRYGGNTPCVELRAGGQTIIIDAGTGIIGLGRELVRRSEGQPIEATLLFSHMHHDHTQGFPFFAPAYFGTTRLHIFGPGLFERDLEETLIREMLPPVFPVTLQDMHSLKHIRQIRECNMLLLGEAVGGVALRNAFHDQVEDDPRLVRIRALRSTAHPGGVLVYRIEWRGRTVVYSSDVEGYASTDRRLTAFARGADVLIHDAQYTTEHYLGRRPGTPATQGWGHSTAEMACDVARAAGVKQLVLFHHEPQYDDAALAQHEAAAREIFPGSVAAYEGLELELQPQGKLQTTRGGRAA